MLPVSPFRTWPPSADAGRLRRGLEADRRRFKPQQTRADVGNGRFQDPKTNIEKALA
jgi:hypothetical protein